MSLPTYLLSLLAPVGLVLAGVVGADSTAQPSHQDWGEASVQASAAQVTLHRISFHGVQGVPESALTARVSHYLHTPLRDEQMLDIAMAVEAYYRENHRFARVILLPQDLSHGVLQLEVMESSANASTGESGAASSTVNAESPTLARLRAKRS